jgi:hypothetical protein
MQIEVQKVINDILEQNKNLVLQLSIARVTVSELEKMVINLGGSPEDLPLPDPQVQPQE